MEIEAMNRDYVIRWSREAGIDVHPSKGQARIGLDVLTGEDSTEKLMRFAALAVAAEREACAQECDRRVMGDNNREDAEARRCATAIRARSAP